MNSSSSAKGNQGYGKINVNGGMPQINSCGFEEVKKEPADQRKTGMKNFWLQQKEDRNSKYYEGLTVSVDGSLGTDGSCITVYTAAGHQFTLKEVISSGFVSDDPIIWPVKDDVKAEMVIKTKVDGTNWMVTTPEVASIFDPHFAGFAPQPVNKCLSGRDFYSKLKTGNFVI
jgi:hypothetical protein